MWRYPGKPYRIQLDGLTIECFPLSRGKRRDIFEKLNSFADSDDRVAAIDALYELATQAVSSVEGVTDVKDFIDCNAPAQIIRLLMAAAQGGSLTDVETKNSESSSPAVS